MKKFLWLGLVGLALMAVPAASQASIIENLSSVTANGSNWNWNYTVTLSGDENFRAAASGDLTEIFDVGGFVSAAWTTGLLTSGNALISEQLTGPLSALPPGDNASILNVVVKNNGGVLTGGTGLTGNLGTLVITSTQGASNTFTSSFASQAQKVSDSTTTFNQGSLPSPGTPPGVPEPVTLVLLGFGLVGLVGAGRKFKK